MAGYTVRRYMNTALKIFKNEVNKENLRLGNIKFEHFYKQSNTQ